jgi:hypothetical protein
LRRRSVVPFGNSAPSLSSRLLEVSAVSRNTTSGFHKGTEIAVKVMRDWDDDQPDWDAVERDFAAAWRATPMWVVSRRGPTSSARERHADGGRAGVRG